MKSEPVRTNHDSSILDLPSRRGTVGAIRRALQLRFQSRDGPAEVRLADWSRTLTIISHAQSTRSLQEADCFTFKAALHYSARVPMMDNTTLTRPRETQCFVKFAWKTLNKSHGANAERKLVGRDIEAILQSGKTPCLPFAINELKLSNNDGLATWEVYRDLVKRSGSHKRRGRSVHLLLMEACGEVTLMNYVFARKRKRNDILQIFLMVFHALRVLADAGVSHNDLHLQNIVVKTVSPTVVSFGGRVFRTTAVPVIIDWDMGCSARVSNRALEFYGHVGIFDVHNPLFDLFGVTKALLYYTEGRGGRGDDIVAGCEETRALVKTLRELFTPVVEKHSWLFSYAFSDEFGHRVSTVQQTPYFPNRETREPVARWPPDVFELTPSFETIQNRIHAMIEALEGRVDEKPAFSF